MDGLDFEPSDVTRLTWTPLKSRDRMWTGRLIIVLSVLSRLAARWCVLMNIVLILIARMCWLNVRDSCWCWTRAWWRSRTVPCGCVWSVPVRNRSCWSWTRAERGRGWTLMRGWCATSCHMQAHGRPHLAHGPPHVCWYFAWSPFALYRAKIWNFAAAAVLCGFVDRA